MKEIKTVNIIGMGALGMLFGEMIYKNIGPEAVRYVMDSQRYERYKDTVHKINGEAVPFAKVSAEAAKPCDLVIAAVKYTGLEEALEVMKTSVGEDTIILSVLNGITSEEIIGARYGKEKMIHTVALGMDAMHFGADLIYTKPGQLCIGTVVETADVTDGGTLDEIEAQAINGRREENLKRVAAFFEKAGIPHTVEEDILRRMWGKFMMNVGLNQTCMVYNVGYGRVVEPGSAAAMTLIGAMREVILLANAGGINIGEQELKDYLAIQMTLDPEATPSMGQDRINKKKSEVEMFAGTVIAMAKERGIPVPANEFLYRRVKEIEAEY